MSQSHKSQNTVNRIVSLAGSFGSQEQTQPIKASYDAIVAGGGHNGLVAACYLAKAGYKVLVLEKQAEFGGATKSSFAFPGVAAKLSRYSYLVSLLPDQILKDLELDFVTLSRKVSSYTPVGEEGVLVMREFDKASDASITAIAKNPQESANWQAFYSRIAVIAEKIAPTLLEPLRTSAEIKKRIGEELWNEFIANPISETLARNFTNDVIRGIVLTDGVIGTFTSASEAAANICFLYHLIGNGSGEWKVPKGGMGKLVEALTSRCKALGVDLRTSTEVTRISESNEGVQIELANGQRISSRVLLAGFSPQMLQKVGKIPAPKYREGSQLKVNMVLTRLPQLRSGLNPEIAFAGTFHIDESYSQLELAFKQSQAGQIPDVIPGEMYCHTLTDPSILSKELQERGAHTLTLFAIHTPARLFERDHDNAKAEVTKRILAGLNRYLKEPIESCLAIDSNGKLCIEVKTPQELEKEIDLPQGNIFHGDLRFPWLPDQKESGVTLKWGAETQSKRIFLAGAGALRGGAVSGIAGHNAAKAAIETLAATK